MAKRSAHRRASKNTSWRIDGAAVLRAIQSSLAGRAEPGALSAFLRRIGHRSVESPPLALEGDPDAVRFLWRLGALCSNRPSKKIAGELTSFLDRATRTTGQGPAVASVLVRAFSSGLYGVVPDPVCGDVPRCAECPFESNCRYRLEGGTLPAYPEGERPIERLRSEGPEALLTEELVSLLLPGRKKPVEAVRAASVLIGRFGGLRGLAAAKPSELESSGLDGLDRGALGLIAAWGELARRWARESRPSGEVFRGGEDFFRFYKLRLRDMRREVFVVVLLDQRNKWLADEVCSIGSLTSSIVHPREVFRRAIKEAAAAVAVVHNHPSGDPTPSPQDREITERLSEGAKLLGIRLLDHVIIGETGYVSFVEEGWM